MSSLICGVHLKKEIKYRLLLMDYFFSTQNQTLYENFHVAIQLLGLKEEFFLEFRRNRSRVTN